MNIQALLGLLSDGYAPARVASGCHSMPPLGCTYLKACLHWHFRAYYVNKFKR